MTTEMTLDLNDFINIGDTTIDEGESLWQCKRWGYKIAIRNLGGDNVHGQELWFYLAEGGEEIFLFCDYYIPELPLLFEGEIGFAWS